MKSKFWEEKIDPLFIYEGWESGNKHVYWVLVPLFDAFAAYWTCIELVDDLPVEYFLQMGGGIFGAFFWMYALRFGCPYDELLSLWVKLNILLELAILYFLY